MPERQRERTIDCTEVQGKDSWCVVRSPKYELVVKAMELELSEDSDDRVRRIAEIELGEELMESAIVEWNWVEDDGTPMPQYGKGTKATDLTIDEVTFLLDHILGDSRRKK